MLHSPKCVGKQEKTPSPPRTPRDFFLGELGELSRHRAFHTTDVHEFAMIKLHSSSFTRKRIKRFHYIELLASTIEMSNITLEETLFSFLFPFGHRHYQDDKKFSEYIKMRVATPFSIYTLYKPYILMMYQSKKSIMIANITTTSIL